MKPLIVVVGADKGGVGKTTLSRCVLDYFTVKNIGTRPFDTEIPRGVLKRFHPEAEIVNIQNSDDQMKVYDAISVAEVTLLDLKAGMLSPVLHDLGEIGLLDMVREGRIDVTVMHIIGNTVASFDEITGTAKVLAGANHVIVKNHTNGGGFFEWNAEIGRQAASFGGSVIDIPQLDATASEHVEAASASFSRFISDPSKSFTMKGKVTAWRRAVFQQFDAIKLGPQP
jgi:hypothetical protein